MRIALFCFKVLAPAIARTFKMGSSRLSTGFLMPTDIIVPEEVQRHFIGHPSAKISLAIHRASAPVVAKWPVSQLAFAHISSDSF